MHRAWSAILGAYAEAADLPDGWRDLIGLHQLHPLLVHAVTHGPRYGDEAGRVAQRYLCQRAVEAQRTTRALQWRIRAAEPRATLAAMSETIAARVRTTARSSRPLRGRRAAEYANRLVPSRSSGKRTSG